LWLNKKSETGKLANNGDEVYNVASSAAYTNMYGLSFIYFLKFLPFFVCGIFIKAAYT